MPSCKVLFHSEIFKALNIRTITNAWSEPYASRARLARATNFGTSTRGIDAYHWSSVEPLCSAINRFVLLQSTTPPRWSV